MYKITIEDLNTNKITCCEESDCIIAGIHKHGKVQQLFAASAPALVIAETICGVRQLAKEPVDNLNIRMAVDLVDAANKLIGNRGSVEI